MIVISDTSPINYLVLIGHVHILPQLFERIIVPPAVFTEINSPQAPTEVRNWLATTPDWLEVRIPEQSCHLFRAEGCHRFRSQSCHAFRRKVATPLKEAGSRDSQGLSKAPDCVTFRIRS